jgi:predicted CXXCH cytochrome family protein
MFKKLAGLTAIAGLFIAGTASAQTGIVGSAHDFSQAGAFNSGGEICVVCHTTHVADLSVSVAPLWDHELSTTDFSTVLYDSGTMTATDVANPGGISRLCLSCHDGSIALDSFGGSGGSGIFIDPAYNVNNGALGLTDDHPISFTYNDSLATTDGELNAPTSTSANIPGKTGNIDQLMLFDDGAGNLTELECASCHDVHNAGNAVLLIKDNSGSALCLTCHSK